jgi:hypothetical protein
LIAVPSAFEGECEKKIEAANRFGLSHRSLRIVPEAEVPAASLEGGNVRLDFAVPPRLGGGGVTIERLGKEGVFREFREQGIDWLLFGQIPNAGCRITASLLRWLDGQKGDGIVECADREPTAESMVYIGIRSARGVLCLDSRRVRGHEFDSFRAETKMMAIGSFWVRTEALMSLLARNDSVGGGASVMDDSGRPGIVAFADGGLFFVVPLWELLNPLDLSGVRVGPDRYQVIDRMRSDSKTPK